MAKSYIAFESPELEKKFQNFIAQRKNYEVGGVVFFQNKQVADMHYKRHEKIFGVKSVLLIQDWLICPNTSDIPDRQYKVSNLEQFIGIAEQTADSRGLAFAHFHTHPGGNVKPSENDIAHWFQNWPMYHSSSNYTRGVIAGVNYNNDIEVVCHSLQKKDNQTVISTSGFLRWKWIKYCIRKDERERAAKRSKVSKE